MLLRARSSRSSLFFSLIIVIFHNYFSLLLLISFCVHFFENVPIKWKQTKH